MGAHEDSGTRGVESTTRAPSHAERCRTLAAAARSGTLATVARDPAGYPYASLVATAVDAQGRVVLLLSSLAEHTGNLAARPEASVLLAEGAPQGQDLLAFGRVTLIGLCQAVEASEVQAARALFLGAHPEAARYVGFKDFAFYRLVPSALRYVGGFGRMSWVGAAEYETAEPDPLRAMASDVLAHMNGDHAAALLDLARAGGVGDASAAVMTSLDRYGFDLMVESPGGSKPARVAFDEEPRNADEVRRAMVRLVKAARARS